MKSDAEVILEAYDAALTNLFEELFVNATSAVDDPITKFNAGLAILRRERDQALAAVKATP
jgi:hypothetical protein